MRYLLQDEPEKGGRWVSLLVGAIIGVLVWGGGLYAAGRTTATQRRRAAPIRVQMVPRQRPPTTPSVARAPATKAPKPTGRRSKQPVRKRSRRGSKAGRRITRRSNQAPQSAQSRSPTTEPVRLDIMLERPASSGLPVPRGDSQGGDDRGRAPDGQATAVGEGGAGKRPPPARKRARAISKVRPKYTRAALRANIEGRVRIEVLVGKDGRVRHAKLLAGLGYGLDERALEAVQRWRFRPATVDGIPVESRKSVYVEFGIRE